MRRAAVALFCVSLVGCWPFLRGSAYAFTVLEGTCDLLAAANVSPASRRVCVDARRLGEIARKILEWKQRKEAPPGVLYSAAPEASVAPRQLAGQPEPILIELPDGMTAADLARIDAP